MWITQHIAARTFVWLAAVTIPVQGLPSVACGCTSGITSAVEVEQSKGCCCADSSSVAGTTPASCCSQQTAGPCRCTGARICRCGEASPCQQQSSTCCSGSKASNSCCSRGDSTTGCSCGDNCQCGKSNTPTKPAAPPVENSSPERNLVDSAAGTFSDTVYLPSTTRQHTDLCAGADAALSALDRCVTLCRFTI